MKKTLLVIAIVTVAVLALGVGGFVYAQSQSSMPQRGDPYSMMGNNYGTGMRGNGYEMMDDQGYDYGMMGDQGYDYGMMDGYGMGMMMGGAEMGALHEYMYPAMAAALGLTPEEFDARHEAGETFWDMAAAQGLTAEETWDLMLQARNDALAQAVAAGVIDQEFADWMTGHIDAMHGEGFGPAGGHCGGGGYNGPRGSDL